MEGIDDLMAKAGFHKPAQEPAGQDPANPPASTPSNNPQTPQQGDQGTSSPDESNQYESKLLNERFGGKFKSIDEVYERVNSFEKLQKEHTDLSERSKRLIEPANDFVKAFNEASSKGIPMETFLTVQKIDQEKNPVNIIALANQIKFNLSPEDALWKAQRQYAAAQAGEDDRGFDPDTSREAKIQLSIDAAESKKFLEQYKSDAMMPVLQTPEMIREKLQQRQNEWKPEIPKVMTEFKKMSFSHNVEGAEMAVDFDVPRETLDAVEKYIMEEVLTMDGIEPVVGRDNDEIKDIVRSKIIEMSFDSIIKKAIADTAAAMRLKDLAQKHNPNPARQEGVPAGVADGVSGPDKDRVLANQFLKTFPINK